MNWCKILTVEVPLFLQIINILFLFTGRNTNPMTFRYNKIFTPDLNTWVYISLCFVLGLIGIYYRNFNIALYYSSPLFLLFGLIFCNQIFKTIFNRNIIIATRWDFKSAKINVFDRIFGFLIVIAPFLMPIIYQQIIK
ncbi:hypothetical protein [Flavobacterium branchiophilum]|uniref:Uncharacterized protein n=1 Tax=Flavobacterium branchiophilum TaxID=55197 RepID=A0A2H3KR63_9FLAO|nr:hypothetical protein [Flavobacterium branchiophilum]PDS27126.1 hypothetical protein B0A77_00240 [Flavobacterium branchiophilum]